MKQKNNTISFVIVNYNSVKELQRCLCDLSKIDNAHTFEVIVINNDTKPLRIPKYKFAKQKTYEVNKNIGYGTANNVGLSHATGAFICFLNPDTHSFCTNLTQITSCITHEKMIIAPQIRTESNEPEPWSVGTKTTLFQTLKNNLGIYKKLWLSQTNISVAWVSGAAMFAPTQFLRNLGGFDEDFFLYFEDVDLCQRARKCGGKIHYIPHFHLTHTGGTSSKENTKIQKKWYYISQDLFFQKHLGAMQTFFMRLFRFLYIK